MLVLSRGKGQSIRLEAGEEHLTIHILKIRGRQVRIGIKAGERVRVVRAELPTLQKPREPVA